MDSYPRLIDFEAVLGFRDLGGYRVPDGRSVDWRRLFRSGEIRHITAQDLARLKTQIGLKAVIDLRNARDGRQQQQEAEFLNEIGARYFYVPLNTGSGLSAEKELNSRSSHMGEIYLLRIQQAECGRRLIEALEIIAEPRNHPLLFHCVAGKDRPGVLAAFVLSLLNVADRDIVYDYTLTAPFIETFYDQVKSDPGTPKETLSLPAFTLGSLGPIHAVVS